MRKEAERELNRPDPKNEKEVTLKLVVEGENKRYKRYYKAELDIENADKKIEELNKKLKKEQEKLDKEAKKKEEQDAKEKQKLDE